MYISQASSVHITLPTPTAFVKVSAKLSLCQSTTAIKASRWYRGRPVQGCEWRKIIINLIAAATSRVPAGTAIKANVIVFMENYLTRIGNKNCSAVPTGSQKVEFALNFISERTVFLPWSLLVVPS